MKKKIAIVLGKGCNYRCSYCFEQGKATSYNTSLVMSESTIDKALEFIGRENQKLKEGEFIYLNLYGGEPLLYPEQATRFIEYASDNQMYVRFITNGSLITKMSEQILKWKEILGSRLDFLVSYDYALQDQNRCKGSYQKVRDGLLWLDENEITFFTNTIFMMSDFAKMKECFKDFLLLKRQLVHNRNLQFRIGLDKIGCRKAIDFEAAEKDLEELSSIMKQNPQLEKHITFRFGRLGNSYRKKSCGLGWRMIAGIDYDGTFYTCIGGIFHPRSSELTFGTVYDDPSVVEAKREVVMNKVVKPLPEKCKPCDNFCRVCAIDVFDKNGIVEENHCKIHGIVTKAITWQ